MKREQPDNHPANPPIDAVRGDHTAHNTVQRSDEEQARLEAGLGADGNLRPDFEGTQPKITDNKGTLEVVPMQDLKERAANADGETVEQQEEAAGLNQDPQDNGRNTAGEQAEEEEPEESVDPKALAEMTIDQISEQIGALNKRQLNSLEKAEAAGKNRTGVADLIARCRAELG